MNDVPTSDVPTSDVPTSDVSMNDEPTSGTPTDDGSVSAKSDSNSARQRRSGLRANFRLKSNGFVLAINLTVPAGQTLAVIGPNGSGKSTLLTTLAGHVAIKSGEIQMAETMVDRPKAGDWVEPVDRPIALVPQDGLLFPHLTVLDNVLYGLRQNKSGPLTKPERLERAFRSLQAVEMAEFTTKRPYQLSGGQAQRVAVARALALQQPILLLDEPLSRIDVGNRRRIRQALTDQRPTGQVQVIVTHGRDHAITADLILAIEEGQVSGFDTPEAMCANPPTKWIAELLNP